MTSGKKGRQVQLSVYSSHINKNQRDQYDNLYQKKLRIRQGSWIKHMKPCIPSWKKQGSSLEENI